MSSQGSLCRVSSSNKPISIPSKFKLDKQLGSLGQPQDVFSRNKIQSVT